MFLAIKNKKSLKTLITRESKRLEVQYLFYLLKSEKGFVLFFTCYLLCGKLFYILNKHFPF